MQSKTTVTAANEMVLDGLGEGMVINQPLQTAGGEQNLIFVLESGLTFLLSRSRTEIGKQLNRLIHTEILPSLRKTGKYQIAPEAPHRELSRLELLQIGLEAEQARLGAQAEVKRLSAQIQIDEPATTLGKAITKAPNNIRIGDFAKSIGMGQNRYFEELRTDGIIQQASTLPYQKYLDSGYFVVTQIISGNGKTYPVALITPKGQPYLAKRHSRFISQEVMRDAIECQVVALV